MSQNVPHSGFLSCPFGLQASLGFGQQVIEARVPVELSKPRGEACLVLPGPEVVHEDPHRGCEECFGARADVEQRLRTNELSIRALLSAHSALTSAVTLAPSSDMVPPHEPNSMSVKGGQDEFMRTIPIERPGTSPF